VKEKEPCKRPSHLSRGVWAQALEALAYVRWMLAGKLPDVLPPVLASSSRMRLLPSLLSSHAPLPPTHPMRPPSRGEGKSGGVLEPGDGGDEEEDCLVEAARVAGSLAGDLLGVCALLARLFGSGGGQQEPLVAAADELKGFAREVGHVAVNC